MTKAIEKLKQRELEASDALKTKQRERADAAAAVTKAEDANHANNSESAEKTWLKAKEGEALAELRLKSAHRALAEATHERETAERAELEREAAALRGQLEGPDPREAQLVVKEAGLLLEAALVRKARSDNREARCRLRLRLNEVSRLLTGVETTLYMHDLNTDPPFTPVSEELLRLARSHSADQGLMNYVALMSAGRMS